LFLENFEFLTIGHFGIVSAIKQPTHNQMGTRTWPKTLCIIYEALLMQKLRTFIQQVK